MLILMLVMMGDCVFVGVDDGDGGVKVSWWGDDVGGKSCCF